MSEPVKFGRFFVCEACGDKVEREGIDAIRAHLIEQHMQTIPDKNTRNFVMHVDAKGHSIMVYLWKIRGVSVSETHVYPTGRR